MDEMASNIFSKEVDATFPSPLRPSSGGSGASPLRRATAGESCDAIRKSCPKDLTRGMFNVGRRWGLQGYPSGKLQPPVD